MRPPAGTAAPPLMQSPLASGGAGSPALKSSRARRRHAPWALAGAHRRAVLPTAAAASALALLAAAALAGYTLSIIHEPRAALAAATAEAQRAAAAAAAAVAAGQGQAAERSSPGLDVSRYTVVVMSYRGRLASLPLVISKLGSCPSAAEVLLVWNGGDPPPTALFKGSRAPVRIRRELQNDLSNRLRPDDGISTAAVLLADDDVLLRCADVERAFAAWLANRQALVGFFPRLALPGPPPQYLGECWVFSRRRFNALLTAGEFASVELLRRYWSDAFGRGREIVSQLTNCEDLLLNYVAAAAIREQQQQAAAGTSPTAENAAAGGNSSAAVQRWPPHVVWAQPSRRLDISFLSGVGLSRSRASHEGKRRVCVARFSQLYGHVLPEEAIDWGRGSGARWRRLMAPVCGLPLMGCVYL